MLVASEQRKQLVATLAAPATQIASFTITEKGYCRATDGSLDLVLADDRSAYSYLAEAFARRRKAGLPGLTLLSCDNLAGNGVQLERLMIEYLEQQAPDLTSWFTTHCTCPSTMVDHIVPATTDADRVEIEVLLGMRDAAVVITEPFSQWVIEDRFAGPHPAWERHGTQITSDIHVYENAKLRMLNGAHSALAYLGLLRGHAFVHQTMGEQELAMLIEQLMRHEAAPSLTAEVGLDIGRYADSLITRFHNPALNHRLSQIAMDGSQKIPQRWLETLAFHQQRGAACPAILSALTAWLCHVRGDNGNLCGPVSDPLAPYLELAWRTEGKHGIVDAVFGPHGIISGYWHPQASGRLFIEKHLSDDLT